MKVESAACAMFNCPLGATILAEESQKPQAEHVEGRQKRSEYSDSPVHQAYARSPPQDFILAEEARQGRDPGDSEGGRGHGPEGPWDFCTQAAHATHVLFAAYGVYDGPGGQKQQALEEGMSHEVKDGGGK